MADDRLGEGQYRLTKILGVNKHEFCGNLAHVKALLRITETARGFRRMDLRIEARNYFDLTSMEFSFDKPVTIDKSREEHDLPRSFNTQLLFKPDEHFHSMNLTVRIQGKRDDDQATQETTFKLRL